MCVSRKVARFVRRSIFCGVLLAGASISSAQSDEHRVAVPKADNLQSIRHIIPQPAGFILVADICRGAECRNDYSDYDSDEDEPENACSLKDGEVEEYARERRWKKKHAKAPKKCGVRCLYRRFKKGYCGLGCDYYYFRTYEYRYGRIRKRGRCRR
jgi:hypothetical protein